MNRKLVYIALTVVLSLVVVTGPSAGPAMDRILKKGVLTIGTSGSQPPMTATNKKGEIIGMDVDIAKAMADAMGVEVKLVKMPFNKLLNALQARRVDMVISGMSITPRRNQKVAFVGPYYVTGKGILAVGEKYTELQKTTGLDSPGIRVAALKNSTSQSFAESLTPKAQKVFTNNLDEAIDLILKGEVDVLFADYSFCAVTAYRHKDNGLIAGASPLTFEPLGIAMAEDALLINWTRNFLTNLQGSGKIEELGEKWLSGGPWVDDLP